MDQKATNRMSSKRIYGPLCEKTLQSALKKELMTNFGFENMVIVADILIERFLKIVNEFSPEKGRLLPYQTMVIGADVHERFGYGKSISQVKLRPAIVTLMTPEEMLSLANGTSLLELRPKIAARILKEAYSQGVGLSFTVIAALLGVGQSTVARMIQRYYKDHPDEVLPHAGTLFDLGRTTTHKEKALELMYQGLLTQEISRRISHYPKRVDKYLNDHRRIVEAYESGHSFDQICFLVKLTPSLVKQHLDYYKSTKEQMKRLSKPTENQRNKDKR